MVPEAEIHFTVVISDSQVEVSVFYPSPLDLV
jgi:hypothetical protein